MARITVEDCLKQIPNRYEMVKLAATLIEIEKSLQKQSKKF